MRRAWPGFANGVDWPMGNGIGFIVEAGTLVLATATLAAAVIYAAQQRTLHHAHAPQPGGPVHPPTAIQPRREHGLTDEHDRLARMLTSPGITMLRQLEADGHRFERRGDDPTAAVCIGDGRTFANHARATPDA